MFLLEPLVCVVLYWLCTAVFLFSATVKGNGAENLYDIRLEIDVMLKKVNLKAVADAVEKLYVYEKVGRLNGHVLSIVNVENRTLDFHVHELSDELFYVIEGSFHLETDDGG